MTPNHSEERKTTSALGREILVDWAATAIGGIGGFLAVGIAPYADTTPPYADSPVLQDQGFRNC